MFEGRTEPRVTAVQRVRPGVGRLAVRRIVFAMAGLLAAVFFFVQLQQHLLRHRAERLHDEIVALQVHPGSFADIQRLQREWGRFGHYDGTCTPHHCIYEITVCDTISPYVCRGVGSTPDWVSSMFRIVVKPLLYFGYKPAWVSAEVRVREDRMWGEDYSINVDVLPTKSSEYSEYVLSAFFQSGPRLFDRHGGYRASAMMRGYEIGRPGGCEGCIHGWINFNTNADPQDIQRLSAIKFNCITRFRQCVDLPDLVPNAWREYQDWSKQSQESREADWSDCAVPLNRLAQEAANIVSVEAVGLQPLKQADPNPEYRLTNLRIVELLKNAREQKVGAIVNVYDPGEDGQGASSSGRQLLPGSHYLLLYAQPGNLEPQSHIGLADCSVFPLTDAALREVQIGVAKDPSVGEVYDHWMFPDAPY
jgi:hypothetical protein